MKVRVSIWVLSLFVFSTHASVAWAGVSALSEADMLTTVGAGQGKCTEGDDCDALATLFPPTQKVGETCSSRPSCKDTCYRDMTPIRKNKACVGCEPSSCVTSQESCYIEKRVSCSKDLQNICGCSDNEDAEFTEHGSRFKC